jgi:hypothetical protein
MKSKSVVNMPGGFLGLGKKSSEVFNINKMTMEKK